MSAVTAGDVGPGEAASLAAGMQQILSLNQEIADLVETERRRCGEELGQFKRARQATQAYQKTIP
jgi:chorismate mutase